MLTSAVVPPDHQQPAQGLTIVLSLAEEAGVHSNLESENASFNHINQLIILGFSSSISWANWLRNLNFDYEDSDLCMKCKAYSRWYNTKPGMNFATVFYGLW